MGTSIVITDIEMIDRMRRRSPTVSIQFATGPHPCASSQLPPARWRGEQNPGASAATPEEGSNDEQAIQEGEELG